MKQIFKKFWVITLFLLIGFVLVSKITTVTLAANDRVVANDEAVVKEVAGSLTVSSQHLKTISNGKQTNVTSNDWNPHTVHWADFNTSNDMKIVTFSGGNADAWKTLTTKQAAVQWEKENPGWIVVAGINGDFFDINGTGQPTGNFMQSGDMYRSQKAGEPYRQTIGWNNDGSVIVGDPTISSQMYVKVYESDFSSQIENELVIANVNGAPKESGVNLYTNHISSSVDLSGYTVYDCVYTINRRASGGSVFVKGTVSSIVEGTSSMAPGDDHFYLATKDDSLKSVLAVNDALKCEQSYIDKWSNVQNSIGYIYQVLDNGAPIPEHAGSKEAFIYTNHPRTLIGFREDGSTVFMAIEGRGNIAEQKIGVSLYEAGEILASLGCVTGYNLDGGGSTTLIARNPVGGFDVINDPSDGNERADGNHCFVVMRNPGFKIDDSESDYSKAVIKLNPTDQNLYSQISDIKITVNGVTKAYDGSKVEFDNVDMNTTYDVKVSYKCLSAYNDTDKCETFIMGKIEVPDYDYPDVEFFIKDINKTSFKVVKDESLPAASWVKNVVVHVDNNTYLLGDGSEIVCDGLVKEQTYEVYYTYEIHDPSGAIINVESPKFEIETLAYANPSIVQFEESLKTSSAVGLKYEYSDEDEKATKAYIIYNGIIHELKNKKGTATISGLDFENTTYEFKLVVEYTNAAGRKIVLESEVIKYEKTNQDNDSDPVIPETPDTPEEPSQEEEKGGCGSCGTIVVSLLTTVSLIGLVFRKRK